MTHTSVHFVFCSLRMKQKPPVNKEENSVFGDTPFQYTHTLLFSPYLPSYTPNHYDSDCSSLRLPPRQSWPRFHQIIQMTSSSMCVFVHVHKMDVLCQYSISHSVLGQLCLPVHFRAINKT